MSYFRYKMIRRDGQVINGVIELPFSAESTAHEHFEERGLTVIAVRRISEIAGRIHDWVERHLRRRVKREELVELLRNMGVMLRSGVPVLTALEDGTTHSDNQALVKVAEDMRLGIETGMRFADAADRHPDVFPNAVRFVMRIGEETGRLDRTLMDAAEHLERVRRIRTDTKRSLIYPVFVLTAIVAATAFWVYYVIPAVADLFRNLNVELPEITLFVLAAVEFLEANLRWMAASLAAVMLTAYLCFKTVPGLRKRLHHLLTVMPITGRIVNASNLAFIAEYFSLFARSGVDILKSLGILEESLTNLVYREKIGAVRAGLTRGNTLTMEFRRTGVFPGFVVRMINVGELSGTLAEQLEYVAQEYRRRLADTIERLSEILKPVAILVVGAFFVFIVVALFLPIYHLVAEISAGTSYQ